ncbi:MAG: T9SS type A sorting domain-containing protein, partial [Aliifodinibius sp.]|nr:T9SS type A sorting domain-containing protein [Fodinibius sp.]NIW46707.1 T9SS type A sorting domain-containing protein [Gammaproteobacteria bacterium]NIW98737.1 T9SS type A sorting domain-containing protein [Phycisphaerae bacterium]NIY27667.1 T9SS type A sorting domain-containing protein [Fodinibius sp.]
DKIVSTRNYLLQQNYPNPFNPTTTIEFTLPQSGFVTLKVYNILGQEVATLLQAHKPAGSYAVNFDASELTSSIYYYTLTADGFKQSRKMVLLH